MARVARRRDCKSKKFIVKQSLSRLRRQLPLHKGAFVLCALKVCLLFLASTAFVDTKAIFLSQQFIYRNANKVRNIREKKDIGITKSSFPFRYGLGADSEEFSKLTLCKPMLLAVIQYTFAYTDFVSHFTRLYIS